MNKIVETGMKIDLHIHSIASSNKDKGKVRFNTIDHIPVLIQKLNEYGVNICAITDHDTFSYKMYQTLKQAEFVGGSIKKVLPGAEFTVTFLDSNRDERVVHVVTIFSDSSESKIENIESILKQTPPPNNGAYSEESFLKILREIDLDTILITHQKNSLSSKNARANDASSLGESAFFELVASDYFEAYEFKNKRNEILNKNYLVANNLESKIRFVTGTDCHDWSVYPKETPTDPIEGFPYTYAKCLPTFRGLVMALTDHFRLKRVNSFFNVDKFSLDHIELESNGETVIIPLSKGINVIIGDNSIGKSMLLHALTGFKKSGDTLPRNLTLGYKHYIEKNRLKIKPQLRDEDIFAFDMQGEVRRKFEENRLVSTEFAKYFPDAVDPQPYKTIINNSINHLISCLEEKFKRDYMVEHLNTFSIYVDTESAESISFIGNLRSLKKSTSDIDKILSAIQQIEINYDELLKLKLDKDDVVNIRVQLKALTDIRKKYSERKDSIIQENNMVENVAKVIDSVSKRHSRNITDQQKKRSAFMINTNSLKDSLKEIITQSHNIKPFSLDIQEIAPAINTNTVQGYSFNSKLALNVINSDYFMEHLRSILKAKSVIDFDAVTESELRNMLSKNDSSMPVLQNLKESLTASFENDFKAKNTIVLTDSDKTEELSAGLNAKIYFDLLSYENSMNGIYIIDQPEDNVSQPAIKSYLLDCFKAMGENRQVILVTHNPQFIVNLDVDNLIYISKASDGTLSFKSGALEYECPDYNVLQLVAENIDGGLDSIQKRWKRYEKANRV